MHPKVVRKMYAALDPTAPLATWSTYSLFSPNPGLSTRDTSQPGGIPRTKTELLIFRTTFRGGSYSWREDMSLNGNKKVHQWNKRTTTVIFQAYSNTMRGGYKSLWCCLNFQFKWLNWSSQSLIYYMWEGARQWWKGQSIAIIHVQWYHCGRLDSAPEWL